MNVVDYLKRFLTEQPEQEAAIPGLGVFYTGQKNGRSCILFKEVKPVNKAFLNFLAFEENIGEEEARAELEKWVRKILQELKSAGSVQIAGVGSFAINGDRVDFIPDTASVPEADPNFGLENRPPTRQETKDTEPAPSAVAENPKVEAPKREERSLRPPVPVDKARGKNTFRQNGKPQERSKPRPVPQPVTAGKELVLGDRKQAGSPGGTSAFYTKWWFISACALVLILLVLLAIKPVRESVFGHADRGPIEMEILEGSHASLIEENVDRMLDEEAFPEDYVGETMTEHEKAVAQENAMVARQVIAGEARRKAQEEAAKKAQSASAKPVAKAGSEKGTTAKPTASASSAKPAAKPQSSQAVANSKAGKTVSSASAPAEKPASVRRDIQKPTPGKFYIIVGSFSSESNARNMFDKLVSEGFRPSILYIEAKAFYYVSVRTCSSREEAVAERSNFRDKRNMECWIFAN